MICQQITAISKEEANHLANKYAREYNCEIENLVLIDNRENLELSRSGLRFSTAEFTKAGVAVTKMKAAVQRRKERKVRD